MRFSWASSNDVDRKRMNSNRNRSNPRMDIYKETKPFERREPEADQTTYLRRRQPFLTIHILLRTTHQTTSKTEFWSSQHRKREHRGMYRLTWESYSAPYSSVNEIPVDGPRYFSSHAKRSLTWTTSSMKVFPFENKKLSPFSPLLY